MALSKGNLLDQEDRLVVLYLNGSENKSFWLKTVYATTGVGKLNFFMCLETFLGMSHTLVLVEDLE